MKTLMLFNEFELGVYFVQFNRDLRHLDSVYINSTESEESLIQELSELLYDEEGEWIGPPKLQEPTKDWDFYIDCGFIP